jgi:hypothetical protein
MSKPATRFPSSTSLLPRRRASLTRASLASFASVASVALLASLGAAGCAAGQVGDGSDEGLTENDQSPIWAQTPGVNVTAQQLTWQTVSSVSYTEPTLTAATYVSGGAPVTLLHAFYRDAKGCLKHGTETDVGGSWTIDATNLGGCDDLGAESPAAVAWDQNRADVFWFWRNFVSGQTTLMHRWLDSGSWYEESLGNTVTSAASRPAVASWGVGHLDVFWRDAGNQLKQREFDRARKGTPGYSANGWSAERTLASGVVGDPTAVERAVNAIDVFWRGANGVLLHKYTQNDGGNWSGSESLGITAGGTPAATSWGTGHIDLVYPTTDATPKLGHVSFDNGSGAWKTSPVETLASSEAARFVAAASAPGRPNRIDIVALPSGTKLSHSFFSEPLAGFKVYSQPNAFWCWIAAPLTVLEYLKKPHTSQCAEANADLGQTTCCNSPLPSACQSGGNVGTTLKHNGVAFSSGPPLSVAQIREQIYVKKQPIIVHHLHPVDGGGHYVTIRDVYRFAGKDYLVIADSKFQSPTDPSLGANWVVGYDEYIDVAMTHPSWRVDQMVYGFSF